MRDRLAPRLLSLLVLALALAAAPPCNASAAIVAKHVPSEITGGEVAVSCDAGPIAANYVAKTASGVPLTGPYAVARGADKGLVHLMNQGGKPAKQFIVPHRAIRAIVRIEIDMTESVDLVFEKARVVLVHTSIANAGIFTTGDVYELPYRRAGGVDEKPLRGDAELTQMLRLGLSVYRPARGACTS